MELIGLLIFSISVAFLGTFQTIPLTNIRPDVDAPLRMQSGYRLGYVVSRIGDAVGAWIPRQEPIQPPSYFPQVAYSPTTASTRVPMNTCATRPTTLASDMPTLKVVTPSIIPTPAVETKPINSTVPGAASVENSWIHEALLLGSRVYEWMTLLDARVGIVIISCLLLACTVTVIVGTTFIVLFTVLTVCRRVATEVTQRAVQNGRYLASTMEEADREIALYAQSLDAFRQRMAKSMGQIEEIVSDKHSAMTRTLAGLDVRVDHTKRWAEDVTCNIIEATSALEQKYLPFPTVEDLLGDRLDTFHAGLEAARRGLQSEVEKVRLIIPGFRKEFQETVQKLRGQHLGNVVELFTAEKQRLRLMLAKLQKAAKTVATQKSVDELLDTLVRDYANVERRVVDARYEMLKTGEQADQLVLRYRDQVRSRLIANHDEVQKTCLRADELMHGLRHDFSNLKQRVENARKDVREANDQTNAVVFEVSSLEKDARALEGELYQLEQDLALARTALKRVKETMEVRVQATLSLEDDQIFSAPESEPEADAQEPERDFYSTPERPSEAQISPPYSPPEVQQMAPEYDPFYSEPEDQPVAQEYDPDFYSVPEGQPDVQEGYNPNDPLLDFDKELLALAGDDEDVGATEEPGRSVAEPLSADGIPVEPSMEFGEAEPAGPADARPSFSEGPVSGPFEESMVEAAVPAEAQPPFLQDPLPEPDKDVVAGTGDQADSTEPAIPAEQPLSEWFAPLTDLDYEVLGLAGGDSSAAPPTLPETQTRNVFDDFFDKDMDFPVMDGMNFADPSSQQDVDVDMDLRGDVPEPEEDTMEGVEYDNRSESVDMLWPERQHNHSPSVDRGRRTARWWDTTTPRHGDGITPPRYPSPEL